jgi:hypothetical protein
VASASRLPPADPSATAPPPSRLGGGLAAVSSWIVGGWVGAMFVQQHPGATPLAGAGVAALGAAIVLAVHGFWWRRRTGRPLVTRAVWPAMALTIALNAPFAILAGWIWQLVRRAV